MLVTCDPRAEGDAEIFNVEKAALGEWEGHMGALLLGHQLGNFTWLCQRGNSHDQ